MGVLWKMTQLRVCKSVLVFQANKTNTTHAESWCYHVTLLLNAVILLSQTQGKRFPSTCSFLFVVNMAMHRLKRQWRWLQCSILAQKEHAQFCPTCYEWCANITDWWHSGSPHPTSSPWVWVLFHQCLMVPCCSALDEVDMDDAVHFTANARKWPQVFQLLLHPPKWKGKLNPICSMCLNHFCMFLLASATPVSPLLPCCTSSLCWVTNKQKN